MSYEARTRSISPNTREEPATFLAERGSADTAGFRPGSHSGSQLQREAAALRAQK